MTCIIPIIIQYVYFNSETKCTIIFEKNRVANITWLKIGRCIFVFRNIYSHRFWLWLFAGFDFLEKYENWISRSEKVRGKTHELITYELPTIFSNFKRILLFICNKTNELLNALYYSENFSSHCLFSGCCYR